MAEARDDAPFILTAKLPSDLAAWATAMRAEHFPPERNFLDAHVTLFHALPRHAEGELRRLLSVIAAETAPVPARLEGVMSLGRGTALKLSSESMLRLRDRIADGMHGLLTSQDQHRPRLHVTVQNKVSPAEAKTLQAKLAPLVRPRDFTFPGLALHIYRGGPWEHVRDWQFRGRH